MICSDIEKLVRRYAPVSLVVPTAVRNQEIAGAQDLLGVSEMSLKNVYLGQISSLIRVQFPELSPRWIIEGKVLSEALTLKDLSASKYIHPNRKGSAFSHQVSLLKTNVASAERFEDIDSAYTRATHLCKSATSPTEIASIFEALNVNEFWVKALNDSQRHRLMQFIEKESEK